MGYKELCGGVHTAPTQQCHWVMLQFVSLSVCVGVCVGQCERTIKLWVRSEISIVLLKTSLYCGFWDTVSTHYWRVRFPHTTGGYGFDTLLEGTVSTHYWREDPLWCYERHDRPSDSKTATTAMPMSSTLWNGWSVNKSHPTFVSRRERWPVNPSL